MQQTTKYQFNLIEGGDNFSPDPLNENMEKVEAELGTQAEALGSLAANVGGGGQTARIAWGSYEGDGTYGPDAPTSLTFDFEPVLVVVFSGSSRSVMLRGNKSAASTYGQGMTVTWSDNAVSWYTSTSIENAHLNQNNRSGYTYYYVALGVGA